MHLPTVNKLYLELHHVAKAKTARDLEAEALLREWMQLDSNDKDLPFYIEGMVEKTEAFLRKTAKLLEAE